MAHAAATVSHPGRRSWMCVLLLAGLLWQPPACLARSTADDAQDAAPSSAPAGSIAAPLPNTDGTGLLPKPPAVAPAEFILDFAFGKDACESGCASKFGSTLGTAEGIAGYSNCAATCIHLAYSFLDLDTGVISIHAQDPHQATLRYIGVVYQCVEYARRWWMLRRDLTFGDVDGAADIIYLTEAQNIRTGKSVPLARSLNGTARRPPRVGDLIVYYADRADPNWRWGHAAVAVDVDLVRGLVSVAEQNYSNTRWQAPERYARQIRLFEVGGRYTLIDVAPESVKNPTGGPVAGWIYPLSDNH